MTWWLNVGCGTHNAPDPWINVDVVERADVKPDVLVEPGKPLPWGPETVARVYAGHVLEHMPWPDVVPYLQDLWRVLEPGGQLFAAGPDVLRTIERYKRDLEPDWMLHTVLEYHDRNTGFENPDWPQARHWWNCWEARLVEAIRLAGFETVEAVPPPDRVVDVGWMEPWPNVAAAPWWCAALATKT